MTEAAKSLVTKSACQQGPSTYDIIIASEKGWPLRSTAESD
jgi:hypothetical protein